MKQKDSPMDPFVRIITQPAPGERVLWEYFMGHVLIRQLPDDPLALRISIGEVSRDGAMYLVFRGDPAEVGRVLMRAGRALNTAVDLSARTEPTE
jgi:hypothetical protein